MTTEEHYKIFIDDCLNIFSDKLKDYGTSWRVLRTSSLTDQLFIKIKRIRNLQINGYSKIEETEIPEFIAIINYSIISMIQVENGFTDKPDTTNEKAIDLYNKFFKECLELMKKKNHDYGEAWRDMRIESITDLIFQKIIRIKQIEDNKGETIASEGIESNLQDILNYSIFCLILSNDDID